MRIMSLFLDSALVEEARRAEALGFVAGATTNPALSARTGRPAPEVITELCAALQGIVFHQVRERPGPALDAEIDRFRQISEQVAFKLPCTLDYAGLANALSREGVVVAMTAVCSPAQVYLAAQAGAAYAIPYVDRTTRYCGSGAALVAEMAAVLEGTGCEILAASIKTPAEAVEALLAGAHHLTLSWEVLAAMAHHALTDLALQEFASAAGRTG
jgi:transaldolase